MNKIKSFFKIEERGSSIKIELLAGLTTFLAMAYILPVNAGLQAFGTGGGYETGMPYAGLYLATALAAIVATLIMGLYANYPIGLAPGMGVNAFLAITLIQFGGATPAQALGAVFVSGVLFLIISLSGLRKQVINAIPKGLKYCIGAGIGFFIAFIGFQNSGIITSGPALVALGDLGKAHVLLTLGGLILGFALYIRGNKFSLIIAMVITAIVGYVLGLFIDDPLLPSFAEGQSLKELGSIKEIVFLAFDDLTWTFTAAGIMAVISLLFMDFFDTAGTLVAVGKDAGLIDENGEMVDAEKALVADSVGTMVGSLFGAATTTAFVESSTGIKQGGRTGLTAVTVAFLFGAALLVYPIIGLFNYSVTSIALIMVGAMMITQLRFVNFNDMVTSVSGFMSIVMMVLTFSIAEGIAFGFIFYTLLSLLTGKKIGKGQDDVNPIVIGTTVFFFIYYILEFSNILH